MILFIEPDYSIAEYHLSKYSDRFKKVDSRTYVTVDGEEIKIILRPEHLRGIPAKTRYFTARHPAPFISELRAAIFERELVKIEI